MFDERVISMTTTIAASASMGGTYGRRHRQRRRHRIRFQGSITILRWSIRRPRIADVRPQPEKGAGS